MKYYKVLVEQVGKFVFSTGNVIKSYDMHQHAD